MKKIVTIALLSSLVLQAEVSPFSGYKYGSLEVVKQYGKINSDGDITNLAGSEVGEFKDPRGIAILSDGSYWVVERTNHRIQHFTKSGEFLGKVGNVNSSDTPITSTENNGFFYPEAIAQDSNDNIYVIDTNNKRVQKFSSDGSYLDTIVNSEIGSYNGIAVDSNNHIWISDITHDHLWKLDAYGGKVAESGFKSGTEFDDGNGDAQFNNPLDIEVASDNSIWVADYYNKRVQHISSSGAYIGEFPTNSYTYGIALSDTNVYALDSERRVYKRDLANVPSFVASYYFQSSTSEKFGLGLAYDIEMDGKDIWLVDSSNNRIKKTFESDFKSITLDQTIANFNEDGVSIYTLQANVSGFHSPKMAVGDADGNIFVLDDRSLRKFNAVGEYIAGYGVTYNGNFTATYGGIYNKYSHYGTPKLAINGSKIYIFTSSVDKNGAYDTSKTYVHVYNTSNMSHVNSFEVYDDTHRGITVLADGSVWLAYDNHIAHYSANGTLLKNIGITNSDDVYISGSDKEQFNNIYGIASDASENIYVSEYGNKRIQVFTKTGDFIKNINLHIIPKYIAVSPTTDSVWFSDNYHALYRLDSQDNIDYTFKPHTSSNLFGNIGGIGFDNAGNILLTNSTKHRLHKYSIGTCSSPIQVAPEVTMNISVENKNTVGVNAEAYDEDGYIDSYLWNFGDGTEGTTSALSHTYTATGTYTITCTVTDNEGSSTVVKQSVMISSLSVGTSSSSNGQTTATPIYTYTQDDINSAIANQIEVCQNNPSGCGISVSHDSSLDITAQTITSLSSGWTLLGTTVAITDMNIFNDAQTVWIMNGNIWKAYSANSAIRSQLSTKGIGTFSVIPSSSGFWVQK